MNHSAIHQHTPIHTAERGKAASPSSPQVIKANVTAIVVTDNRIAYIKSVPPPLGLYFYPVMLCHVMDTPRIRASAWVMTTTLSSPTVGPR